MNDTLRSKQELEQKKEDELKKAFDRWMANPMTKMAISLIPPSKETPEVIETLLQDAFREGWDRGGAHMVGEMVGLMFKDRPKDGGKA